MQDAAAVLLLECWPQASAALSNVSELTDVVKQTQVLREELLAKYTELPSELVKVMLSRFIVNGAVPVTLDDIKALLNNVFAQMRAEIRDAHTAATHTAPSLQSTDPLADPRFQLWMWRGRSYVPEGWRFPATDVKATWNLWHFGHMHENRPLRYLKKVDLVNASQITVWSKCRGVMKTIAAEMVEMKLVQSLEEVEKLSAIDSSTAFDQAIVQLMEKVKAGSTRGRGRWMEMSIQTLYDHVGKLRAKKRKRQEKDDAQTSSLAAGGRKTAAICDAADAAESMSESVMMSCACRKRDDVVCMQKA